MVRDFLFVVGMGVFMGLYFVSFRLFGYLGFALTFLVDGGSSWWFAVCFWVIFMVILSTVFDSWFGCFVEFVLF